MGWYPAPESDDEFYEREKRSMNPVAPKAQESTQEILDDAKRIAGIHERMKAELADQRGSAETDDESAYREYADRPAKHDDGFNKDQSALHHAYFAGLHRGRGVPDKEPSASANVEGRGEPDAVAVMYPIPNGRWDVKIVEWAERPKTGTGYQLGKRYYAENRNAAFVAALAESAAPAGVEGLPQKLRPDFMAGYDAGMKDGKAIMQRELHPFEPALATAPHAQQQALSDEEIDAWRTIESAPKEGYFLAFHPGVAHIVAVCLDVDHPDCEYDGGVHEAWSLNFVDGVTHWMPLPKAPKAIQAAIGVKTTIGEKR